MEDIKPRLLVVEDDPMSSLAMTYLVEECACDTVGPAASVASAMGMIQTDRIKGALLDVNLGNELVWPVAEALDERRIPFILVTGYSRYDIPRRFADRPFLAKPVSQEALQRELSALGLCPAI